MKTIKEWIRQFFDIKSKEVAPIVQFARYGFCGAIATIVHQGVWALLAWKFLPGFEGMEYKGEIISDSIRSNHNIINNIIAFPFGNIAAYLSNVAFVFTRGRHSFWKEFGSFTLVALVAVSAGLIGGPLLIRFFGISAFMSQGLFLLTSLLVNFAARKFFIFQK